MAVKGKGKQVAAESPGPGAGGASGSGGKRRKASGDAGAGPSSSSAAKRRRRAGVLQFVDDVAGVDDDYEEEEEDELELESEDDPDDGFFTGGEHVQNPSHKRTERSHPLPFLVKEEELSGDELEEFIKTRYSNSVKYAADRSYSREDDDIFPNDCALKEPTIWRVKCMVGRERQMAFCFMQKFVDLRKIGTKVPIITAFALDHIRGFVFVEAEKACDVTEACKGFCSVYVSRITSVPAAEVPSLLSSRTKPFVLSRGTWVRMKNGNYKGDLAQVVIVDDGRKKVMIKIIPRVDLHAISKKFGGAVSLKEAAVPAPRLISSQELEFFRPHIEIKRDRQTGEVFEVLDGLMFKDGFLYKKVALSSLIYWGIQPTETELLKFSSSPTNRASADDLDWLSGMYGSKKRNLPAERDMKPSSSKLKSSKTSDLKASTSTENYDDNDVFNLHDLVLYGRKDFGVIIAVEKDGFRILKGGPEGSAVTVRKQDIKKVCVDKMFTAVDHQKKTISINDTVNVVDGPFQGKQGVVKHLYLGILFIYNESESENCGFFCAQSGSCEKIRKGLGSSTAESSDFPTPMFSEPTYEQNEHRDTERPYRSTREQLFSVGQMLRIRKGPLKGYLCRVVRIFRNDVTVKLDSLLKTVTVQADLLSVPANRGDNLSGAPASKFGSQDTSFFGSEAGKTSWDNGLPSFGSDSWQPFSSSTAPVQNAGGESEADPWCKKTSAEDDSGPWGKKTNGDSDVWGKEAVSSVDGDSTPWGKETVPSAAGDSDPWGKKVVSSADGDSDPWGKKAASSAVEVWNTSAIQKEGSSSNAWDKQAGVGGSDAAGSSWDRAVVNKESAKSDNWGEACRVMDMGTGADTDPWGSKVKAVDVEGPNSWEKATVPPDSKLEDASQGWGQPKGNSTEDQTKDNVSKDVDNNRAWGSSLPVTEDGTWGKSKDNTCDGAGGAGGWDASAANWTKSSVTGDAQNEGWGKGNWSSAKSEETNNDIGNWNKAGASDQAGDSNWDKPKSFGGDGWNKGDDQNSSWNRPGNFGGRGFGRGRGRDRGQESGDFNVRNDQRSWKNSWGGDNAERPSWRSDNQVDNEGGSGGYRGRGRGGRGQYGGRGRDNGWRNGDRSDSVFGRESNSGDGAKWGGGGNWNATNPPSNQPWSSSGGTKSYGQNQPSTLNNSEDNKQSVGEQGDPWASRVSATEGKEQQNDPWSSKMTSGGAEDTSGGWDTKAKDSSFNDGGEGLQNDPWANKIGSNEGKEQENDPWASKMSSTVAEINCFVDVNKGKLSFMLSMDSEVTWKMFNEEMSKYLGDFDLVNRSPRYSYEDEDGDRVFFESDLELKEALSYAADQELFIILVDAAEKEVPQAVPSIPSAIPQQQEVPQQNFEDLSDVVNVIGKALQKDLPQIANVIENVLGDKDSIQNNLNSAVKFISQFCEEEKEDIEKLVEEFLPGLIKVPKQKKVQKKAKKVAKKCSKKPKVIHHAICDYCSKHIEGIRYKCLQCPDYDLCETCEAVNCKNKFHDEEHVFAKIVKPLRSPVAPNPHFAARMMRGPCPGQQRFERVRNLEDKVQNLENELAQIKALLLNNNNNQSPVENSPEAIPVAVLPEVSSTEQQQQVEEPQPEQQPEPVLEDLTEAERECFEQLKAMGFDIHSSIVSENNADLSLILEKIL